ncbi:MAG TPA: hypothetical protein VE643_06975 [Nitrososphaeraceae archaeon]|nr:hypothetical protein [Nitrososphaeraceae archaeon]
MYRCDKAKQSYAYDGINRVLKITNNNNNNILAKEIDSWGNFEYALREENSLLLTICYPSARKMRTISKLLALKINSSQINHCLCLNIIAASYHKRINCQRIGTKMKK